MIHISSDSRLNDLFTEADLRYAFFTGTQSPHRKAAVQIMAAGGVLKGFAKIAKASGVKSLVDNEARVLDELAKLGLKRAIIPSTLLHGDINGATVLVTDTLKSARSRSSTTVGQPHLAFLDELAAKTRRPANEPAWPTAQLRRDFAAIEGALPLRWRPRLLEMIDRLAKIEAWPQPHLSHGDFTATNTFFVDTSLYVFDWEYSSRTLPPGYDLIHFALTSPALQTVSRQTVLRSVSISIREAALTSSISGADALIDAYLCAKTLFYASREAGEHPGASLTTWDGEPIAASLFDAMLERPSP